MVKILKLAATLGIFCVFSSGLLAYVYGLTVPRIEANAKASFEGSLREVLPGADRFRNAAAADVPNPIFEGYQGEKMIGLAVQVAPRGYSGDVKMLVGVDPELRVLGLKVLSQKETPGLGTEILKPKFLGQFIGKGTGNPLEPKKDIDAITGATISSRAVSDGVKMVLRDAGKYKKGKP
jgi:electron transport complex protein RnfG